MIERILVARRGEAAARVARTGKRLGITTIALREPEDADQDVHIDACDEVAAVERTSSPSEAARVVVEAALAVKADAIHPGYVDPTFLAELLPRAAEANLRVLAPTRETLEASRDRLLMRRRAEEMGLRVVPSGPQPLESLEEARRAADAIGGPVLFKARLASGGTGTFAAEDEDEVEAAYRACSERARERTGDARVIVESWIPRARLLEVLVVGGREGSTAALPERDTSLRDGLRPLLQEAPSPALVHRTDGEGMREAMAESSVQLAVSTELRDVASVQFLMDSDGDLLFLGMEVGLPADHGLVEMITGVDVVEHQIRVGNDEKVDLDRVQLAGSAFCAWVRANVEAETATTIGDVRWPPAPQGRVRVEPSVRPGGVIAPAEDPLLRVVAFGPIRHQALLTLDRILADTRVSPIETNVPALRKILGHEAFRAGQYDMTSLRGTT